MVGGSMEGGMKTAFGLMVAMVSLSGWQAAVAADVTWTGAGADQKWSTGANWSTAVAPLNPTIDRFIFTDNDLSATVAKVLADIPDWEGTTTTNTWRVGGLRIRNTTDRHLLDLDGKTLRLSTEGGTALGDLYVRRASGTAAYLVVSNGTLAVERDIMVDQGHADLTDATLRGPLRDIRITTIGTSGNFGSVDLRGGAVDGGILEMRDLWIGSWRGNLGVLYMDNATAITTLRVRRNLLMQGRSNTTRIGWPDPARDDLYFLPENVSLELGDRDAGEAGRGNVRIGRIDGGGGSINSRLAVDSGGAFDGWLNNLVVGRSESGDTAVGDLDLRGLNLFTLDAVELAIGVTTSSGRGEGRVWLPAGTARVDRVTMGSSAVNNRSELELVGTVLQIDEQLEMHDTSGANPTVLTARIQGTSSGLDLAGEADLDMTGPATIELVFEAPPTGDPDHYWGLRWAGNKSGVVGPLVDSGAITSRLEFAESDDYKAVVYVADGYTFVALLDAEAAVPPAVSARDRTVEVDGQPTIRIDVDDLLVGIVNPDGLTETGRVIEHPFVNGGAPAGFLDFPTGTLPIIYSNVVLTVSFEDDVTAEDTAHVTFLPVQDGSSDALTWTGEASDFVHLDRREWFWGANWSAWQPPLNPTAATLTFADADTGDAPKLLAPIADWDGATATNTWRIGSLRVGNTSGRPVLDLGGQTLELAGVLRSERLEPTGTADLLLTNGVVVCGSDLVLLRGRLSATNDTVVTVPQDIRVELGHLRMAGATLHGQLRDIRITVGGITGNFGSVDLRGADIVDGVLDVRDFEIGSWRGNLGVLYMDNTTDIGTFRVRRNFYLHDRDNTLRIGWPDPARDNLFFLPVGLDIEVGVRDDGESGRGNMRVAWITVGGGNSTARVAVDTGGSFDGWLNNLIVGWSNSSQTSVGVLDLRGLNAFALDAVSVSIGMGGGTGADGRVYLPSGTAVFGTLEMGGEGSAELELNDTVAMVTNGVTLHAGATVATHVADARASGLDLPALPTVIPGANLSIVFTAPPAHPGLHYGLRVAGDVVDDLQAAGWLSIDDDALPRPAQVFRYQGDTYVGIAPPPGSLFLLR